MESQTGVNSLAVMVGAVVVVAGVFPLGRTSLLHDLKIFEVSNLVQLLGLEVNLAIENIFGMAATLGDKLAVHVGRATNGNNFHAADVLAVLLDGVQEVEIVLLFRARIFASGRSESAELVLNADNRVLHVVDLTFQLVGASLFPSFCLNQLG